MSQHYKIPYVQQFNLAIDRLIPGGLTLTNAFVASLGKDQSGTNSSLARDGAYPSALPFAQRQVYYAYPDLTNLSSLGVVENYFTSSFFALESKLKTGSFHGMNFNVNYTWSHVINDSPTRYVAYDTIVKLKENGPADVRNRVNLIWIYDLPYHRTDGWYSQVLREWQLDAIALFEDGNPFTVTEATNPTNSATGTNTPNQISSFKVGSPNAAEWFNPAAFQQQANYTWGDEMPLQLYSPGDWHMDMAIHRTFDFIHERLQAQFRLEAFDFTNTRFPSTPVAVLGQNGFGSIETFGAQSRRLQGAVILRF
jgi:hypothetical protein